MADIYIHRYHQNMSNESISRQQVGFNKLLISTTDQIHSRYEVENVLNDIVQTIELYNSQTDLYTLKKNYGVAKSLSIKLLRTIDGLDNENRTIRNELSFIKKKSTIVREKFALQISSILKESKQLSTQKSTINTLERRLADIEREYTIVKEKVSMQETVSSIVDISGHQSLATQTQTQIQSSTENDTTTISITTTMTPDNKSLSSSDAVPSELFQIDPIVSLPGVVTESITTTNTFHPSFITEQQDIVEPSLPESSPVISAATTVVVASPSTHVTVYVVETLLALDNDVLLNTFSFLTTVEVLNFAQSCRMLFRRVNQLFGMESQVAMNRWTEDFDRFISSRINGNNKVSSSSIEGTLGMDDSSHSSSMVPVSTTSSSTSSSDLTLTQSIASSIFSSPLVKLATGGKLGVFPGGSQSVQSSPVPSTTTMASKSTASSSTSNGSSTSSNTNTTTEISSGGNVTIVVPTSESIAQSSGIGATANTNAPSGGLTREMAEQLAKKLNAAELTAIKALSDLLRKQTGQMTALREDKELVETKLQVGRCIYMDVSLLLLEIGYLPVVRLFYNTQCMCICIPILYYLIVIFLIILCHFILPILLLMYLVEYGKYA